jgi:hypothetical protein
MLKDWEFYSLGFSSRYSWTELAEIHRAASSEPKASRKSKFSPKASASLKITIFLVS